MFIEREHEDLMFFLELCGFVVLFLIGCNLFLETFVCVVAPSFATWGNLALTRFLTGFI